MYNGKELNNDFGLDWSDYGARWYDASIGRWTTIDPLSENYYSWNPYVYVANNPLKFIDPDGMRIDVTDLMNGGTESDAYLLLQLMIDLSDMSGSVITKSTDENGKTTLMDNGCGETCQSEKASAYISHLLNDDGEVRVFNSIRHPYEDERAGSKAHPNGFIFLDANEALSMMASLEKAGLNKKTMSIGLIFIHETLHTRFGASYYKSAMDEKVKRGGIFVDPDGGFSKSGNAGETVKRVNAFRMEMKLPERTSYGGHKPTAIRFAGKDVQIIRGNYYTGAGQKMNF